jgi:aminoglycoside phosphotransferase (APT) family kinase protein
MAGDDPFLHYLPQVREYLKQSVFGKSDRERFSEWVVEPLAKGEYNCNYLLRRGTTTLVFRVNIDTQIGRDDQIIYEYQALELLKDSGVTPVPLHVDDSRKLIDRGILIMEYLPGRPLDYRRKKDLKGAARAFARIHQLQIPPERNHLIREEQPLSLIYDECSGLLERYFRSRHADSAIVDYLMKVKEWAAAARAAEYYFVDNPWPCIVNTETNSGNFIVNEERQTVHLIDWEMPRFGDPSTDLCHFCSPLTTLWKTTFCFSPAAMASFIEEYRGRLSHACPAGTLEMRMRLKNPFVYLRGISWSAYAWAAYQEDFTGVRNEDTWKKLCQYMRLPFITSLFQPLMEEAGDLNP